ncbi:ATP phosphoribosyltransferase regulatory subunit [Lacticaseibacillus songhuajiangensis]|uniref:ATP phosphoribosyltransferase regulatory subunit n=1 Tax=Lacticaseibacillus songhuajiangensis TaxID=1296539 RepID=UPI000F770B2D|nr:ATP phosphoribosyltransferase regulatory subunit [Lacticaseibacillus songhuajiangensis]
MSKRNLPIGTRDEFGELALKKVQLTSRLQQRFIASGFAPIKTPVLEYRDVFDAMAPTVENAYQFLEESGESLILRPDLTLPVARVMSTTGITPPTKWCYVGDVFRIKKRHSVGYYQITQAGIEIIGYQSQKAERECLLLAAELCRDLGIDDVTLELSDAGFVDTILAELPAVAREPLKQALFNKNLTAYAAQLARIPQNPLTEFLQEWPWLFGDAAAVLAKLPDLPAIQRTAGLLRQTISFLQRNAPELNLTVDLSSQTPQPYYTGLAFRAYAKQSADYLFSGGRYDRLLSSFQQTLQPAVGFSFDVDALSRSLADQPQQAPTLIYFNDQQWTDAQALVQATPNASLCLVDTLREAQMQAQSHGASLINLTQEVAP